jgi:transposase
MMIHLKECHGIGEKKISEMLGVKRSLVRKFLKQRREGGAT